MQRKGAYVLFSSFYVKATAFLMTLSVIHLVPKDEFGYFVYANTIIAFLIPFQGFGVYQGLLRYGSIADSQQYKKFYLYLTLKKGVLYSGIMILGVLLLSPFISKNLEQAQLYLMLLSLQLISSLLFECLKIYTRLLHLNKAFSLINIYNNTLMLITAVIATYFFGVIGYVISLIAIPLLYSLYLIKRYKVFQANKLLKIKHSIKEFIRYGLYISLSGVMSQLLYAVDIMLIGNLIVDPEALAQYKTSNIIPFSLHILPLAIMTTDYVKLANDAKKDPSSIKTYYFNYLKIAALVSVVVFIVFYFFSDEILWLFGKEYTNDNRLMFIFSIGTIGALLFRVPLGNMLSAIGWPKVSALISFVVLVINVVAGYYFVMQYGVLGAAYTTISLMWLSGILSLFAIMKFWKS